MRLLRWLALLQVRLALLGLAALLGAVALTTALQLRQGERQLLIERSRLERAEAQRTARFLDQSVHGQREALELVARELNPDQIQQPDGLQALMRQRPLLLAQFSSVQVLDHEGQLWLRHDERGFWRYELSLADQAYFRDTRRLGRSTVSAVFVSPISHQPTVAIAVPLFRQGRFAGLLAGSLRPREHPMLARLQDPGAALTVVLDAEGRIVAHADRSLIGRPMAEDAQLADLAPDWVERHGLLSVLGQELPSASQLRSLVAMPTSGWALVRLQPRASVLAPLQEARRRTLWSGSLAAAVGGLLLLALLWRLLRPLRQLRRRAAHLFEGDVALDWPESGGEIGQLAAVLRRVAAERQALEQQNNRTLRQLQTVLAAAPLGIMVTRERVFELVSPEACRLLGRHEAELLGQPARIIFAEPQDYEALGRQVAERFAQQQVFSASLQFRRGDGSAFWGELSGHPVGWQDPAAGTVWTLADVSDKVAQQRALEWRALHDPLTGLANRAAFQRRLDALQAVGLRAHPAALLMLDLDRFKPVNDQFGHAAGDALLQALASVLQGRVRPGDLVARLGGDEFAVLLERCAPEAARRIAQELLEGVRALRVPWQDAELQVGVSIGLAALAHEQLADWLAEADAACYAAKAAGRNTVREAAQRATPP